MPIDPTKLLKHTTVKNPQFEAYAPLDGKLAPLVGILTIDGTPYRFVSSQGRLATLREITIREFEIIQTFRREMSE